MKKLNLIILKKTKLEGEVIDKVIPFWFWAKNNMMLVTRSLLKNPNRINHINNLISDSIQATGVDSTALPDYVKNQGYLSMEGIRNMITGQKPGSTGAGDDSFLKWGSIVNAALNPMETLSGLSPLISAGKAMLGERNKFATNWDRVSQQYNYMRAVAGDINVNPEQAMEQMEMFNNPFAKLGMTSPRMFSVAQQLDPTPFQGWIKMMNGWGTDISSGNVGAHTFFPSVVKHVNPIDMKMTQLYFEKGLISQLKKNYANITGTYLPALFSTIPPKQVIDNSAEWETYYKHWVPENANHRTQQTINQIIAMAVQEENE